MKNKKKKITINLLFQLARIIYDVVVRVLSRMQYISSHSTLIACMLLNAAYLQIVLDIYSTFMVHTLSKRNREEKE